MTTIQLYRKHKAGEVSKEKFLYEVRRDNNLPFITNLTSYEDAVKILKNKGIVTDETPVIVGTPAIGLMTEAKEAKKELTLDTVNPYEYRHGLQHELEQMDEYNDEALEKAKSIVLKNLAKDANFYSNLLNQKPSPYEFKAPETDAKGMQAKADGYLKKELKKDEKANVQDSLGKKEEGSKKPKGVKVMPDKGVTGSEKTIKEGFEINQDDDQIEISADSGDYVGFIENGKVSFSVFYDNTTSIEDKFGEEGITEDNWKDVLGPNHAFVKIIDTIGGDVEALGDYVQITVDADKLLNSNIKEGLEEAKKLVSKEDKIAVIKEWIWFTCDEGTAKEDIDKYNKMVDMYFADKNDVTKEDFQKIWGKVTEKYGVGDVGADWEAFPETWKDVQTGTLVNETEKIEEDIQTSNPEEEFNSLLSKYDWYYEMSDDPRVYDRGTELDKKLKVLGKQIGVDKAIELFNTKAPSDRKITSSFFMEGKDKHSKLKEILKNKVKEAIYKKSGSGGKEDLALASSPKSQSELSKKGYVKVPGTEDAVGLK